MTYFRTIFGIFIILSSCARIKVVPPPKTKLFESLEPKEQKSSIWWAGQLKEAIYHEETRGRKKACALYQSLSKQPEFPLKDFATIKTIKRCRLSEEELKKIWKEFEPKPWLEKLYLEELSFAIKDVTRFDFLPLIYVKRAELEEQKKIREEHLFVAKQFTESIKNEAIKNIVQEAFEKHSPRFNENPKEEDYYRIGRDFDWDRNFKKAREYYKKTVESDEFDLKKKKKSWYRYAYTFRKQNQRDSYYKALKEASDYFLKEKEGPEYLYFSVLAAREQWTMDKPTLASKNLQKLLKSKLLTDYYNAKIKWLLSEIALEKKNQKKAMDWLNKIEEFDFDDEDELKPKLFWTMGFTQYLSKNWQKANEAFEKAVDQDMSDSHKRRFNFWYAKTFQKLGNKEKYQEILNDLKNDSPNSYYGILAAVESQSVVSPLKCEIEIEEFNDPTFQWLQSFNLKSIALEYLKYKQKDLDDWDEVLPLLNAYSKIEAEKEKLLLFFKQEDEDKKEMAKLCPQFIYPLPFYEKVSTLSKKKQTLPLIYAIMRQESLFDRYARSPADAFGLLQLIPSTAKRYAKKAKVKYSKPHDLYEPEKNILIATELINDLLKKQKRNIFYTAASYNAGKRAVDSWKKTRFLFEDDFEDIEKIPYKETRKYAKLVFRNFIIYSRLMSEGNVPLNKSLINL